MMNNAKEDLLWMNLPVISAETEKQFGDRAFCLIELYNDWIEISSSIRSAYGESLAFSSLVAADFFSLGKELHWLHRLLHWGNYPLIHRVLRFDWELMFHAYYADVYQPSIPGDRDQPGKTVDKKVDWLESHNRGLNWHTVILPITNTLVRKKDCSHYGKIWRALNHHVHPTKAIRHRSIDDSALMVRDSFDKKWADESIHAACDVFDLIWLLTLRRFPKCRDQLSKDFFRHVQGTRRLLSKSGQSG
jgi:hypothetical protein